MKLYMNSSKLIDQEKSISDWYGQFMETSRNNDAMLSTWLTSDNKRFKDRTTFYTELHNWYDGGGGARFRSSLQWIDTDCNKGDLHKEVDATCEPTKGLLAMKMGCTLTLAATDKGNIRYETMTYLRQNVTAILGDKAFPYSFQFLYWEETGVIGEELVKNLLSCAAVIIIMICAMIPHARIAPFVIFGIVYAVVALVGFMHWWDVTISGVSTIYILISVGLAVDYSAHIAHMFVTSTGTGPQHAVASTLLAVIIIGFSDSYVFRVFFKALFLTVLIGGAHGLLFLPAILSLFGGDRAARNDMAPVKTAAVADDSPRTDDKKVVEMVAQGQEEDQKLPEVNV